MFRISILFLILLSTQISFCQNVPLVIKWQEIYGQVNGSNIPVQFLFLEGNNFFLSTNNTKYDQVEGQNQYFRTFGENIIDFETKKIRQGTFENKNLVDVIYSKEALLVKSYEGTSSSSAAIEIDNPGVERLNQGISVPGYYNLNPTKVFDLLEEESGNFSGIGYTIILKSSGIRDKDLFFLRFNKQGESLDSFNLGSDKDEVGFCFSQVSENEFIVLGTKQMSDNINNLNHDLFLCKINTKTKQIVWEKTYGGSKDESSKKLLPLGDGTYYIVSTTKSNDGDVEGYHSYPDRNDTDTWILKIDANGNILWKKTIGGVFEENPNDALIYEDNSLLIGGDAHTNGNQLATNGDNLSFKSWLLNIDSNGNQIWQKFFSGQNQSYGGSIKKLINSNGKMFFSAIAGNGGDFSSSVGSEWNAFGRYICLGELEKEGLNPTIQINSIENGRVCSDSLLNFTFNVTGQFSSNNNFRIELSDENGSFSNPILLKLVNSPGTHDLYLSDTLEKSKFYKLRVVSTFPHIISSVNRRIEIINKNAKVKLVPNFSSIYPFSDKLINGQKIPLTANFEGFGPYSIKFSNNSIYNNINSTQQNFYEMINSNSVFKIIELKNPCGISQDITGEYPINDFKNICLTQLSDNSKIESLTIKRNGNNIFQHRYLYDYIYDYLNFCSENQNKNLNIGDTLKVEFSISDYSNYKCWIDLNNNNTFDVNEEISSSDTNSLYKNFHTFRYIIPQNLPLNEYRLRLTTKKNEIVNSPCGRSTSIDFCFTIIPNPEPKITNINVNNNNLSVCIGSLIDIEIDTLGKFENNNIFKLYLSNSNGKFEDSRLIGQSNLRSFQSTIPNIEIGNEFRYRLMVTSSNPKVSFELSQDLIINKIPYLNLKDTTMFIISYSDIHEVYVKNAGSIPLNFTTNSGFSGSIPNSYSVIRVPISNINEIFFTRLSNSCGTTESEGKIFLKKYNPYDFKVKLYDKMGLVSTFNNSNFHQGEFNLHQLADSINIQLEIPENISSYSIKGFAGLNVTRSGRIVQNDFYLFQNFIAKGLKSYSFIVELFGDIDQKILINKYEYSFSIVESKAPCKTYIFDCTINPNDYINNFMNIRNLP